MKMKTQLCAGVVWFVSAGTAGQGPATPAVTRIDAFHNIDGQAFSEAGKGKDYLRLHVENLPGPCLRLPRDVKLLQAGGKETRAMTVSMPNLSRDAICDTFDVIFPPLPRATRPQSLVLKEATIAVAVIPIRTEVHAAFVAGSIAVTATPHDEGKSIEATLRNRGKTPLTLYSFDMGGAFVSKTPMVIFVLGSPTRQDIDIPAGGEVMVRFTNPFPARVPWTSGTVTLMPEPEK